MTSIENQENVMNSIQPNPVINKSDKKSPDILDKVETSDNASNNDKTKALILDINNSDITEATNCDKKKNENKGEVNNDKIREGSTNKVEGVQNAEKLNTTSSVVGKDSKLNKTENAKETTSKSGNNLKRKRRILVNSDIDSSLEENNLRSKRKKKSSNDSFCWRCHKESVEAHCSACPRSWHRKCIGMQPSTVQNWICGECVAILQAENAETRSTAMAQLSVDQLCLLLRHVVEKMREFPGSEPFWKPVEHSEAPNYLDYVVKPMDLSLLESNVRAKLYGSTDAFMADAKWIQHNCIVFNTCGGVYTDTSKLTNAAKHLIKLARQEVSEIEACPDCYAHGRNLLRSQPSWFIEPCRQPHPLVWAKLKGFPYWPAKAMPRLNGQGFVDVRFFGEHDRAWVPPRDLYLYSEDPPVPLPRKRKLDMEECVREITRHCRKLELVFGQFKFAPPKVQYNPHDPTQIKLMLPNYDPFSSKNCLPSQFLIPEKKFTKKRQNAKARSSQSDAKKANSSDTLNKSLNDSDKSVEQIKLEDDTLSVQNSKKTATDKVELISNTCENSTITTAAITDTTTTITASTTTTTTISIPTAITTSTATTTITTTRATTTSSVNLNELIKKENDDSNKLSSNELINNAPNTVDKEDAQPGTSKVSLTKIEDDTMKQVLNEITVLKLERNNNSEKSCTDRTTSSANVAKKTITTSLSNHITNNMQTLKESSVSNADKNDATNQSLLSTAKTSFKGSKTVAKVYKPKTRMVDKVNAEKALKFVNSEKSMKPTMIQPSVTIKQNDSTLMKGTLRNLNNHSLIVSSPSSSLSSLSPTSSLTSVTSNKSRVANVSTTPTATKDTVQILHEKKESKARKSFPNKSFNTSSGNSNGNNSNSSNSNCVSQLNVSHSATNVLSNSNDSMLYIPTPQTENCAEYQMLPPEAGPISARLYYGAQELVKKMAQLMEEAYKEVAQESQNENCTSENNQATIHFLRLQMERMRWQHQQQLADLKQNTDRILREMKASSEAERMRAIEETRREVEQEKIRCIEEIKRKQWCAMCGQEALFYCCWNTAYCNYPCQQAHWPMHMKSCAQKSSVTTNVSSSVINSNQQQAMPRLVINTQNATSSNTWKA